MPRLQIAASKAEMLRRRRALQEAVAALVITLLGAAAVGLAANALVLRLAALVLPLAMAGYAACAWLAYGRSRAVHQALLHEDPPAPPSSPGG